MYIIRPVKTCLVSLFCLFLTSCTTISREIQSSANSNTSSYPAAEAQNPELEKPLLINLKHYKSVQTRPHQRPDIAIALAASGGGYRAANLTLGVLMGLEKIRGKGLKGNLLQEVDYYSTVSGGGFGVGYYFDKLHQHFLEYGQTASAPEFSLQDDVSQMLASSQENPLRLDLTEHLFFGQGRGLNLEKKINEVVLYSHNGGLKLGDIFIPTESREEVRLPYWAINATIFQNAAVFPFTPDILARYRVTGYFHNGLRYHLNPDFNNPWYGEIVPVSIGLTASATVPFATPATTLITNGCGARQCYLQLLDGGMADNLGVYTALNLLIQDKSKIKVLIIVDAYKGNTQPYSEQLVAPGSIPLLWRIATVGTDSNREHIKPNVRFITRGVLCENGAKNVIVIYLDLSHYPAARKIGTQLTMSPAKQKLLIQIGQEMVANDESLQKFLTQLNTGELTFGRCQKVDRSLHASKK